MEINYDLIIKFLSKSNKIKKLKPEERSDFKYFKSLLKNKSYLKLDYDNSILSSIIFLLNSDKFYFNEEKMFKSIDEFLNELEIEYNDDILINVCSFFNINILIISDKLDLYSSKNIINLSLPFILLYKNDNKYNPIYENKKKLFFYHNSIVEDLLDNNFNVNHDDYQLLDDVDMIIDEILEKRESNNIFTSNNQINNLDNYKRKKKNELIEILIVKDLKLKKSNLLKLKKTDLIKMLLD